MTEALNPYFFQKKNRFLSGNVSIRKILIKSILFIIIKFAYIISIENSTVIIPQIPIARPLIAPSISPISIAFDVPTA